MSKDFPLVSVIIATYNSEKTLEKVLYALRNQDYPQDKIEIIWVDGGSVDKTREICKNYKCNIVENPSVDPVSAKTIGYRSANGKYVIVMDHDEVLVNEKSIRNKVEALTENPNCKVAFCSGYKRPAKYPLLNQYLSEYGDPYSLFMYRFSKYNIYFERDLGRKATKISSTDDYSIYRFNSNYGECLMEMCCLATMLDKDFFEKHTDFLKNKETMVHLFYIMNDIGYNEVIVLKNDPLLHYSVDSVKAYLPKLKWRIVNNIHYQDKAGQGFSGRSAWLGRAYKKYLFPLYTATIIIPFMDGMIMALRRKNPVYIAHFLFCLYVTYNIVIEYIKKIMGFQSALKSYDGKKIRG